MNNKTKTKTVNHKTAKTGIRHLYGYYHQAIAQLKQLDFVVLLLLRVYLAPIFIVAGYNKWQNFADMVAWYGDSDWGLGLPFPTLMVVLTIFAELFGGIALLFGVLTRFFSVILSVTMGVAIAKVHWVNGWFAIAPTDTDTSITRFFGWFSQDIAIQTAQQADDVAQRLTKAREILQEYGNYYWLTETGSFVVLNNGIEFATTYLIMLLILVIYGAGRYVSVDDWLTKKLLR